MLCVNKSDVVADENTFKKWDEDIAKKRAPALNALLHLADEIGVKVVLFNWAGVSMRAHLLIDCLHMEYVSVYVQNLYHPRYCVTHNQSCGRGDEGKLKAMRTCTYKIFAASEAVNGLHIDLRGLAMKPTLLESLSGDSFKYVNPSVLVPTPSPSQATSSRQMTVVIDEDLVDFDETEDDDDDDDDEDDEEYEDDDDDDDEDDDGGLGVVNQGQPTTMFDHSNQVGAEIIATSIRLVSNSLHFSRASSAWHVQRLSDCGSRRPVKRH